MALSFCSNLFLWVRSKGCANKLHVSSTMLRIIFSRESIKQSRKKKCVYQSVWLSGTIGKCCQMFGPPLVYLLLLITYCATNYPLLAMHHAPKPTHSHMIAHHTGTARQWNAETKVEKKREQKWGTSFVACRRVEIFFFSLRSVIKIPAHWSSLTSDMVALNSLISARYFISF